MAIKQFSTGEVLTAADTNLYLNNGGLVYINTLTLSGVNSANSAANTFTSTYSHYYLVVSMTDSNAADSIFIRLRTGTTTNANANYQWGGFYAGSNQAVASNNTGGTVYAQSFQLGATGDAGYKFTSYINLIDPQATAYTTFGCVSDRLSGTLGAYYWYNYRGQMSVNTSYDAYTILTGGGNMTGTVTTYGYRIA